MWRPGRLKSVQPPEAKRQAHSGSRRDHLAVLLALVTAVCLGSALYLSKGTQLLMPGPLTSGHGAIENCSACHTKSGSNKLSWLHGLVAADPLADSKACLTCHKMPDTAFNAHGASTSVLKQSTKRLTKIAAGWTAPQSARAQSIAFPMEDVIKGGLYCATCHQEHQGVGFNLNKISNEQCRSCHVVQFDSFDGSHPSFENYPFERRTRIVFDHAGHFAKHYPEVAKKDPAKRIPATCATCHNSGNDRRVMAVAPFDQTCTACHLDQVIGKERVSGPKGIAFLVLPGLDLETLKKKNAPIGEWPDAAEGALTPFMKMMIGRNEQSRALIKAVDSLNLQDLTKASDDQIKLVTDLVWEIKGLFHALIKGKASDVLGNLNIGGGAKLSATLVADLTASIPRDVVIGAQQEWLPNLATEMANGPIANDQEQSAVETESNLNGSASPEELSVSDAPQTTPQDAVSEAAGETDTAEAKPDDGKETLCADEQPDESKAASKDAETGAQAEETETAEAEPGGGEQTLYDDENGVAAVDGRLPLQNGTPRAIKARTEDAGKKDRPEGEAEESDTAEVKFGGGRESFCANEQSGVIKAASKEAEGSPAEKAPGETDTAEANADGGNKAPSSAEQPESQETEQFDDLLFPEGGNPGANKTGSNAKKAEPPEDADSASNTDDDAPIDAPPDSDAAAAGPQTQAVPVVSIESDVDPESWAEYGGWYRQDYAIFYRPTGHKDKFIYSWLFLTGPQAPKGATSPAAAVVDYLISKDAQGACTKCHSVDSVWDKGRVVNFAPASVKSKLGRFTNFTHEPHMGVMDNRGCLTCHELEKNRPYLKSFEQGNPLNFVSSFGAVKKELCQTCHASGKARQDCLLCHKYHVNGAITPIMNTRIPAQ